MRQCLFCENSADSLEHVLPQWLLRALAPDSAGRMPAKSGFFHEFDGYSMTRDLDSLSFKTRRVCAKCNNGWMAELEGDVQLFLSPLVEDAAADFPSSSITRLQENAECLSVWLAKTALLASHALPNAQPLMDIVSPAQIVNGNPVIGVWVDFPMAQQGDEDFGASVSRQFLVQNGNLPIGYRDAPGTFHFCIRANRLLLRIGRCPNATVGYFGNQGAAPIRIFPPRSGTVHRNFEYRDFNQFVGSVMLTTFKDCTGEVPVP